MILWWLEMKQWEQNYLWMVDNKKNQHSTASCQLNWFLYTELSNQRYFFLNLRPHKILHVNFQLILKKSLKKKSACSNRPFNRLIIMRVFTNWKRASHYEQSLKLDRFFFYLSSVAYGGVSEFVAAVERKTTKLQIFLSLFSSSSLEISKRISFNAKQLFFSELEKIFFFFLWF